MSIKSLEAYASYAKYAKYLPEKKRRETWSEQVERQFGMHERKFAQELQDIPEFREAFDFAKDMVQKKYVLGSQRSLQFGGESIEKHNTKMYNCVVSWADRPKFFGEMMYMLLSGSGVGFSVQDRHISKLPSIRTRESERWWMVEDSIEGWADAISVLISSYFAKAEDTHYPEFVGTKVNFDYDQIRPEGALISGGFKAPGSQGLQNSMKKIEAVINNRLQMKITALNGEYEGGGVVTRLRAIDVYDICMHAADAVLSGGVRRSASICLFDADNQAMVAAKTGNWLDENPQRARSNNSAVLIKGFVDREVYDNLMLHVKQFGEPGFIWLDDPDILYNPCVEIGMYPAIEINDKLVSGWQGCNLTEENGKKAIDEKTFMLQCKASAIIGTMQASYTDFRYLEEASRLIFEREALLGASITGMMENPELLFGEKVQQRGATEVLKWNSIVAKWIGINEAARATCIKPAGTSSLLLGTSSGVHPHHAKRYIRTVQANKLEFPLKKFMELNPLAVEKSKWSANGTDYIISFLCEVPTGSITKNQLSAIELLNNVKTTQLNWVEYGTRPELCVKPYIRHNVSNTITVKDGEWEEVADFIWDNQDSFSGVSLLSETGDKDYIQAPNQSIMTPTELAKEYGDAAVLASGLIVDGLHVFTDLWQACDYAEGKKTIPVNLGFTVDPQLDWIRRANQFADRYFEGNAKKMTYCLKMVNNWKRWVDMKRTWVDIDWDTIVEEEPYYVEVSTTGAVACNGGACEL